MTDFVEQCRLEWRRLGVPDALAEEMAADLAADLTEAEAEGVSAEELLGSSAFDPRSFAASWAAERGIIPAPPRRGNARRRPLVLVAFTALAAIVLIVAALLLLTGQPKAALVTSSGTARPHLQSPSAAPFVPLGTAPARPPPRKPVRPGRVDPAVLRDRRARLRRMAVVGLGPPATTQRPGLATRTLRSLPCREPGASLPRTRRLAAANPAPRCREPGASLPRLSLNRPSRLVARRSSPAEKEGRHARAATELSAPLPFGDRAACGRPQPDGLRVGSLEHSAQTFAALSTVCHGAGAGAGPARSPRRAA